MISFQGADGDDTDVKLRSREAKGITCLKESAIKTNTLFAKRVFYCITTSLLRNPVNH